MFTFYKKDRMKAYLEYSYIMHVKCLDLHLRINLVNISKTKNKYLAYKKNC